MARREEMEAQAMAELEAANPQLAAQLKQPHPDVEVRLSIGNYYGPAFVQFLGDQAFLGVDGYGRESTKISRHLALRICIEVAIPAS